MVYQIIKTRNSVFLETLVITLSLLVIGFSVGFFLENSRTNMIIQDYKNFEIEALDLKLQNYYYQIMDEASCEQAIKQNFIFADNIYDKGLLIEKYEKANQISEEILLEKKRYVLLKTELWLNSILLKNKCSKPFHTVVYLYSSNANKAKEAEQGALSDELRIIKDAYGDKVILLPVAGDLGLDAINMQLRIYNISYFPSIIIDESVVLKGYQSKREIEKYIL